MKDTFIDYGLSQKVNHFMFDCEVFGDKDQITQSRKLQIELSDKELLWSKLISWQ